MVTFAWVYFRVSARNASKSFDYSPGIFGTGFFERPGERFISTSDWRQMVDGRSEKKGARDFLPKKELDWIMRHEKVSKEEILEYAKQYIEYRRGQIKEHYAQDEKGIPESISTQVTRLEGIIKTLEEE